MTTHDPAQPGLAGRSTEQAFLVDAFEEAQRGNGRLVLIGGEAGIGKTTLVQTLANHARDAGAVVLTGSCYDLTTTSPYGPWVDMLDMLASVQDAPQPPAALRDATGVAHA